MTFGQKVKVIEQLEEEKRRMEKIPVGGDQVIKLQPEQHRSKSCA